MVGILAILFVGLPTSGPVMCGSDVMHPGDVCRDGGIPVDAYGKPRSNYDVMAARNAALHAGSPPALAAGMAMITLGGGLFIRVVLTKNRRRRPLPD
ncbi:hypothetical protein [Streptomyces sp. A1136]|uniref:hypothetical protein n=1 Tax=Streptomyces sp. A1136 TaxID=2563102 RepID=UPI00109EC2E2|nr:hypothetical protein [Streptomyces sp. A1136]THA44561.1 hypothetical protein E6R62_36665 [Streptomyces sp. A1136]